MATLEHIRSRCIEDGPCWIWQGALSNGIPATRVGKRTVLVRRHILAMSGKAVSPRRYAVIADCENPLCVSPECIKAITRAAHAKLLYERGDIAQRPIERDRAMNNFHQTILLSMDIAREIRRRSLTERQADIARSLGLDSALVSKVCRGVIWRESLPPSSIFDWATRRAA